MADETLYTGEAVLVVTLGAAYGLWALTLMLGGSRPGLRIARPVFVALALRLGASFGVSLTSAAQTLRGGDEIGFLNTAHSLANHSVEPGIWASTLTSKLYVWVFAAQFRLFNPPESVLRITQAGIAVTGLVLLAVAVYDLAGGRAALVAAWILALEPANIFFSTLLHKEPLMFFAEGLVAFGGARLWRSGRISSLLPMVLGGLVALATRSYAGWFLVAAAGLIALHASVRHAERQSLRSLALFSGIIVLVATTAPTVWQASSDQELSKLQVSQSANASDQSNLKLEQVDFSTRDALITNLPGRMIGLSLQPYPWQVANASQRLGVFDTFVVIAAIFLLLQAVACNRGQVMARAGPLIYLAFCLLVAYSLSTGNAGTGFRYRTHVVAIVVCLIVVLRERAEARGAKSRARANYAGPVLAR